MKRLVTILFLLFTATAFAQRITDNNTRVGYLELRANRWFHLPEDTILSTSLNANVCQQVAKKNGTVYTYDCILHKWKPIVSNATVIDSGRISNDTLYLHKNTGGEIAIKLGFYTTSQADARFLQKVDTASLSNRINAKVNISDTASMLSKYLRKSDTASLSNRINLAIPLSQKGATNGVAPIGADGKVPSAYLPSGAQIYKGTWDASTNTPTLADGTGTAGWTYRVTMGGTRNLGSGNITFAAGDDVIYNGSIWQRNPNGATVTSVNGQQGAVVLTTDEIAEGSNNKYFTTARVNAAETDPTVPANVKAITSTNISNWNTAFGWGNHASAGYLTTTTGDARYPLLSGAYANPSWLTSLPWSKITGAPAFITGNQTITLTGDITGTGTTGIATTLRNTGTAGTYTKVTTDAQGRVTTGTDIDTIDIPSFSKKVRPLFSGSGPITFGNTTGIIGWNGTTSNVPEGTNLYWTNARGDARYPLLSGAYANPSWLTSLPWSKITGAPTTLAGYGITDAAPVVGSGNYIQNNTSLQSANSTITGTATAGRLATYGTTHDLDMYAGTVGSGTASNLRFALYRSGTEASGNVGNDFSIARYDNSGGFLGAPFSITRSNGLVNMPNGLRTASASGISGTSTGNANSSFLAFYENDGSTRVGYIGKGATINSDFHVASEIGDIVFSPLGAATIARLSATSFSLGTGQLALGNATSNVLTFGNTANSAPSFNTRSVGTKIVLYNNVSASSTDYGLGAEASHIWIGVPQNSASLGIKIYGGTTEVSRIDGTGSQQWNGSGRFKGWGGPANSGPAAEIGMPGGYAIFAGIDRTTTATYYPTVLRGGSGSNDPSGKDFRIDGSGYGFLGIPNFLSLGTNASGYVINTAGNFLQNQTNIAQSGVGFWTAGAGIANRFAAVGPVASTTGDFGLFEGSSAAGANQRWRFIRSTTEASGNVGNNLTIQAMDNSGGSLFNSIVFTRSNGKVTTPQGLITSLITAQATNDLDIGVDAGQNYRFSIGGSEKVTITKDGILSVGNSSASTVRASPLQVQGNVWSTDAYILGTGNAPVAEFGLSGTADAFVRTMGTGNVTFQTNAGTIRATVNGTTGNFEIANQVKISGGSPGSGKVLTSDGSGLATWSSGNVKSIRVITASYTATTDDYTIINRATTGTPVLTLPAASSNTGREYVIVDEAANITANGLAFSPGVVFRGTTYTSWVNAALSATTRITVQSDGTNWIITSQP